MSSILNFRNIPLIQKYFPEPKWTDEELSDTALDYFNGSEEIQEAIEKWVTDKLPDGHFLQLIKLLKQECYAKAEQTLNEHRED